MSYSILIHPYSKAELAHMYVGFNCTDANARRWLRLEISKCPGLAEELLRLGFTPRQKCYTISQVRAIIDAIGEPCYVRRPQDNT